MNVYLVHRDLKTDNITKEPINTLEELYFALEKMKEDKEQEKSSFSMWHHTYNISFEENGEVIRRLWL